jgi:mRNA-degrading endonuclease toxin of MazEF toxin-antitoxin module
VCWATILAGFGHDQGTRPWLVISVAGPERAIVLPISTEQPGYGYPLSWPVPPNWRLEQPSWIRVDYVRSLPVDRLREPIAEATRDELGEVLDAVGELLGVAIAIH